jgi:hypothetical protein
VTLFSGICEGGPLNGKPLHHGEPVWHSATLNGKSVTRPQQAKKIGDEKEIKWFTYHHKGDRWICKS